MRNEESVQRRNARWRNRAWIPLGVVPILALAACGSSNKQDTSTASAANAGGTSTTASASLGSCGTVPNVPFQDPDGIVATLPKEQQAAYNGYPVPVTKSVWANFKGAKKPWTIGRVSQDGITGWGVEARDESKKDFAAAKKGGYVTGSLMQLDLPEVTPAAELAGYQAMVRKNPTAIVLAPFNPKALADAVTAAGKKGILTFSLGTIIPSPYSVNLYTNPYLNVAKPVADVMKQIGGKGNILVVRGAPGTDTDNYGEQAVKKVLSQCPNIKVAGEVVGNWAPALAKAAVLKFLASHPGKIDAVVNMGVMAPGIIGAFQQTGRTVPPVTESGAFQGSLAYWLANKDKGYDSSGTGGNGHNQMNGAWRAMMRILSGDGVKVNNIATPPIYINADNLTDFTTPGVALDSPNSVKGAPGTFAPDAYLNPFFNKPGTPPNSDVTTSG